MKKENEKSTKLAKAVATLRKSGLTVTDETKKGGSIGISGVRDGTEKDELTGTIGSEKLPAKDN